MREWIIGLAALAFAAIGAALKAAWDAGRLKQQVADMAGQLGDVDDECKLIHSRVSTTKDDIAEIKAGVAYIKGRFDGRDEAVAYFKAAMAEE